MIDRAKRDQEIVEEISNPEVREQLESDIASSRRDDVNVENILSTPVDVGKVASEIEKLDLAQLITDISYSVDGTIELEEYGGDAYGGATYGEEVIALDTFRDWTQFFDELESLRRLGVIEKQKNNSYRYQMTAFGFSVVDALVRDDSATIPH